MNLILRPFDIEAALLVFGREIESDRTDLEHELVARARVELVARTLAEKHKNHVTTGGCPLCFRAAGGESPRARTFRIVDTDNFGRDYPNEGFVGPHMSKDAAEKIAIILNDEAGPNADRFFKVVAEGYKLAPGFEP